MMKRSRFTQEQIIGVLKEHQAGATAPDLCRKHGIREATFYAWRSKCGGMVVSRARKLKSLEGAAAKAAGGIHPRCLNAAGDVGIELLTHGLRRCAATWAIEEKEK
jgi:putative transposase